MDKWRTSSMIRPVLDDSAELSDTYPELSPIAARHLPPGDREAERDTATPLAVPAPEGRRQPFPARRLFLVLHIAEEPRRAWVGARSRSPLAQSDHDFIELGTA